MKTLGRVYVQNQVNVFEFLDPTTGQMVQRYALDPMFPGKIFNVFLYTWMVNDDYFHWNLIGQDDNGGYCSHRMPTEEKDELVESLEAYEETEYGHDEL